MEPDKVLQHVAEVLDMWKPPTTSEAAVKLAHDLGVRMLFCGEQQRAIDLFIIELAGAGPDPILQAQALMDIGDWLRRVPGDAEAALKVFDRIPLNTPFESQSRAWVMKAMVHLLKTEKGEKDPTGFTTGISCLHTAIAIANVLAAESHEQGIATKSFALHRFAGAVCNHGTRAQKDEAVFMIRNFLPLVTDVMEQARFKYAEAMCIVESSRTRAIALILEAAHAITPTSKPDACFYFCKAGEWLVQEGKKEDADECLREARSLIDSVTGFINSRRITDAYHGLRAAVAAQQ